MEDGKVNTLAIILQFSHSWKIGSVVVPHVHWTQTQAGDVLWQLEYSWLGNGEIQTSYTTVTTIHQAFPYTSGSIGQLSSFGEITPPESAGLSAIFKCRVSRLGDNVADTYGANLLFNEFDIHYQIDFVGSELQLSKLA